MATEINIEITAMQISTVIQISLNHSVSSDVYYSKLLRRFVSVLHNSFNRSVRGANFTIDYTWPLTTASKKYWNARFLNYIADIKFTYAEVHSLT